MFGNECIRRRNVGYLESHPQTKALVHKISDTWVTISSYTNPFSKFSVFYIQLKPTAQASYKKWRLSPLSFYSLF